MAWQSVMTMIVIHQYDVPVMVSIRALLSSIAQLIFFATFLLLPHNCDSNNDHKYDEDEILMSLMMMI